MNQTERRRGNAQRKADWLRANPDLYQWLLNRGEGPTGAWRERPTARIMVGLLQEAGIYSRVTTAGDICYAMRNAARRLKISLEVERTAAVRDTSAAAQAVSDLLAIFARPGVHLPSLRRAARHYQPPS